MPYIKIKCSSQNGGRFKIYIDDELIDDHIDQIEVPNSFQLCVKEYKVFSNNNTYKQELFDILMLRGRNSGGSWDDITPPNYTTYKCCVQIEKDATLTINMRKHMFHNKDSVFNVTVSDGIIENELFQNSINEIEFAKFKQYSVVSKGLIALLLILFLIVTYILGGISAFVFFFPICLLISIFVALKTYFGICRLNKKVKSNKESVKSD